MPADALGDPVVPDTVPITSSVAIVDVLEDVAEAGAKPAALHRGVEAVVGKISRNRVQSEAGELAAAGTIQYDPKLGRYFAAGIDPDVDGDETEKVSVKIIRHLVESFDVGRSTDGIPFIVASGSNVVTLVNTRRFREQITALAWEQFATPAARASVDEVAAAITGMAFGKDPVDVWNRVAPIGRDKVVVDLGDPSEAVVVADRTGWRVADQSPGPLFVRTELTAPMPRPVAGGDPSDLWSVIRVAANRRDLMIGWLASAFIPEAPHLLLSVLGEQGTAKTETLRAISMLIDPLTAPTRTLPRDIRDLAVTLAGSWAVAFDNVSFIRDEISDALCRSVTGDSWVTRSLFTDSEISSISFQRVVMMDGIDLGILRGDFLDRAALLTLEPIPGDERRTLFTWKAGQLGVRDFFTSHHATLFGVVLDALVDILTGLDRVDVSELPRMADAAVLLAAMDATRGSDATGEYRDAREENVALGVESDLVAMKTRDFAVKMHRSTPTGGTVTSTNGSHTWAGSATQLLENVTPTDLPKNWPTTAHHFTGRLRRAAPGLRSIGIDLDFSGRSSTARSIVVTYSPNGDQETLQMAEASIDDFVPPAEVPF